MDSQSLQSDFESHSGRMKRNVLVDILAIFFGIGSWIGVTSTYLQMPLMVRTAPEGWSLPSYIVVAVQCGNIGSLIYVLYQKFAPKKCNDGHLIYITYIIGVIGGICMALYHQETIEIAGQQRSVALLVFTFMFALVGCLSSVLFMPYMGRFRDIYMVSYLFGQGLNGFLSSILALIQGVGGSPKCIVTNTGNGTSIIREVPEPLFGSSAFFAFVFVFITLSGIAFVLLNSLRAAKQEYAAGTVSFGNEYKYDRSDKEDDSKIPENVRNLSAFHYKYLMIIVAAICLTGNGMFPGIQSYSCLPYGSVPYHLSVTFAAVANPLACFIAMFVPHTSIRNITMLMSLTVAMASYVFITALQSPSPPLVGSFLGEALIVSAYHTISRNKLCHAIDFHCRWRAGRFTRG